MQWVQTKQTGGKYAKVLRFKCNSCGTTQEIPLRTDGGERDRPMPQGWKLGTHEGWHLCPGCEKPRRGLLPVL